MPIVKSMSVSSIGSSLSTASLATLLGTNKQSTGSSSASSSASSAGDAVSVDLSAIAKAASSGDTTTKDAAVKQLKADLSSEQTALFRSLINPDASSTDASDTGNDLLSQIYGGSKTSSFSAQATGTTLNVTA